MKHVVAHVPQAGRSEASAGIISPEPLVLEVSSYIYRFASSRYIGDATAPEAISAGAKRGSAGRASYAPVMGPAAGRWWVREEDFNSIMERADRAGGNLGQKARWDLAVLQKWGSRMDIVIQARVNSKLWAWCGLAKPQQETDANGQVIRLYGNRTIRQLYLHDVTDASGMLTARGREALSITGAKVIPSSLVG